MQQQVTRTYFKAFTNSILIPLSNLKANYLSDVKDEAQ